jgi:DNA-directed RNA polymerase subunit M/transcription elongation factor TFIIS
MSTLDGATEWRRLSELYGRISDDELLDLARKKSELTDVAQEALASEMSQRRLKLEPEPRVIPAPMPEPEPGSAYYEDRRLVEITTVWSLADALRVQQLLDGAGIPFFMGPEKATSVDLVTSNFANGVGVSIMNIGLPWARQVLQNYFPKDEPEREREEEIKELSVHCPKCRSTDIIFDELIGQTPTTEQDSPLQYEWTCGSCGHKWTDDGIVGDG